MARLRSRHDREIFRLAVPALGAPAAEPPAALLGGTGRTAPASGAA